MNNESNRSKLRRIWKHLDGVMSGVNPIQSLCVVTAILKDIESLPFPEWVPIEEANLEDGERVLARDSSDWWTAVVIKSTFFNSLELHQCEPVYEFHRATHIMRIKPARSDDGNN